jgi:hypothetical protein
MKYGPVDVVVFASTEPKFDGSVIMELARLAQTGTIRVLDAMVLFKGEDGSILEMDIEDLPEDNKEALAFIETGTRGLFDSGDAEAFAEGMVPGAAVVALAIENAWAVGLINAIEGVGAEIAMHTRIPAVIVDDALAALDQ